MKTKFRINAVARVILASSAAALVAAVMLPQNASAQATVTSIPALLGGDLTDPENDGVAGTGNGSNPAAFGWNWVSISGSDEADFGGGEFAYNVFANNTAVKWCCNAPPVNLTVEFDLPVSLTHFTLTSSNDSPLRDPRVWSIQGSNDGVNFVDIYAETDTSASQWGKLVSDARRSTLRFDLDLQSPAYKFIRYNVVSTGTATQHALAEIEYFGTDVIIPGQTFIVLAGSNPDTVERATAWTDPGVADVLDEDFVAIPGATANITVDSSALNTSVPGSYPVVYTYTAPILSGPAWADATAYVVNDIVDNGGTFYTCILDHTSAALATTGVDDGAGDNEPGIGLDAPTNWKVAVQAVNSEKIRFVNVVDTSPPTVVLNGDASITIPAGVPFVDPGATATDANDAAVTPVFSNAAAPKASEATAKWTFDQDNLEDSSLNGYTGTPQGTMTYSSDTPFGLGGKSIDFQGADKAFYVDDGTPNQTVFEPTPGFRTPAPTDPTMVGQWTVESTGPGGNTDTTDVATFVATNAAIDASSTTTMWDNINFGDGANGKNSGDSFYPGAVDNNPDNIAIRATGTLHIPVDGDYDIGFQSDDGSTLAILNTNTNFQLPLLESATGATAVSTTVSAVNAANIGSVAEDALGAPVPTDPFLEGGSGNVAMGQPGALVNDAGTSATFNVGSATDTLNVPFNAALNPVDADIQTATGLNALPEMSIEFWAKPTQNTVLECPISNMHFSANTERAGWLFYQNATGQWEFRVGDLTVGYLSANFDSDPTDAAAPIITPGQWQHVVGVVRVDKTTPATPVYDLDLYVDGVLKNTLNLGAAIPIANTTATIRMGATTQLAFNTGQNYHGDLDEVALYDKALTAADVLSHYENGIDAPARSQTYQAEIQSDAPIGYWPLDDAAPAVNTSVAVLFGPANGGDVRAVGRITLTAGDYPIKFISRERTGGEHCEVFAKAAASATYDPLTYGAFQGYPIDSPLTISFYAKRSGWNAAWSGYVTKRGEVGQGYQVRRRSSEDKVVMTTRGLGNDDPTQGTITSAPDGNWHHFMAQYDGSGGNRKLWIDGVLDYDVASTGLMAPAPGYNFAVGANDNNPAPGANLSAFYRGQMDEVCVFHRTLTEDERLGLVAGGTGVDTNVPGTYTVRYVSFDPSGNPGVVTREVIVGPNLTIPVITLNGGADITQEASQGSYVDAGATVATGSAASVPNDPLDANNIVVSGSVDLGSPGVYVLTYNYTDVPNGTALEVSRIVRVVDTTAPVLTLNGPSTITITEGEVFVDPGATGVDIVDGSGLIASASEINPPPLIGSWTFDNDVAGFDGVKDSSGLGKNGELIGNGVYVTDNAPGDVAVAGGKALNLNGDNYVRIEDNAGNAFYEMGSGPFTVAVWVKGWPNGNWEPFVSKRGDGGQGWQLRRSNNTTSVTLTTRGAGNENGPTQAVPQDGNWHHLVGIHDGTQKFCYVDGVQQSAKQSQIGTVTNAPTSFLTFGARDDANVTTAFSNTIMLDDIKIYRAALDQSHVDTLVAGEDIVPYPTEGTYTVTYTITDNAGNTSTLTRTVVVNPPKPMAITNVTLNPDNTVDITWNSKEGRLYGIDVSIDLETWDEVEDNVIGNAGESTTYQYTGPNGYPVPDPGVTPEVYLRVREL